ncbi:hypothetical protein OHT77_15295 [Streptomyces sp. NBC_00252]|uniref:hypothetical protein n=1 Tax=Streptomyces sp. NBC_00252 TaxID=2975691 RepID=UPI002E2929C1|nr:hypothetical protein [Streptomyces sp. NBC_00252]
MGSLFEELEAREAAALVQVEGLEAELVEVSGRLDLARAGLERLRIARETVAEMTPAMPAVAVDAGQRLGLSGWSRRRRGPAASRRGADGSGEDR